MKSLFFIIIFSLVSGGLAKSPEYIQLKYSKVSLLIPKNWQRVQKLFGMPLMLLGPKKEKNRPVLSITSTNIKNLNINEFEIKKNKDKYFKGRREWLKKRGGVFLEKLPMKVEDWSKDSKAYSIGFKYDLKNSRFSERTYYVICKKQMFHIKSLSSDQGQNKTMLKMIRSFKCF